MKKQAHLKIYGTVQGVFFRAAAREKAKELGLTGWVRNAEGESVEALAQGEEAALHQFVSWCERGPERARVTHVEKSFSECAEAELPKGFSIRPSRSEAKQIPRPKGATIKP